MILRFLGAAVLLVVLGSSSAIVDYQFQRGLLWEDNRYNLLPVYYSKSSSFPAFKSLKAYYPRVIVESGQDRMGVGWAAAWNARTAAEAIACNQTTPGEIIRFAFAPAYNYGLVRKGADCKEAISLIDFLESMEKNGTPYFSEFREYCAPTVSPEFYPIAKSKRLSGSFKLFHTTDSKDTKVESVKYALINNHAVVAGIICPPSFQLATEFWQPREGPDLEAGGHALCVVGYDDTKFGGAFEVLNTWGKEWGVGGYTWLRYKDFADFARYGFSLFQVGSAACKSPLEGNISFRLTSGEELTVSQEEVEGEYKINRTLATGSELVITAGINRPVYFYSYFKDSEHSPFVSYPIKESTPPILFDRVRIPEGNDFVTLTEPAGRNELYFIFSPEKVDPQSLSLSHRGSSMEFNTGVTWQRGFPGFSSTLKTPVVIKVYLDQK